MDLFWTKTPDSKWEYLNVGIHSIEVAWMHKGNGKAGWWEGFINLPYKASDGEIFEWLAIPKYAPQAEMRAAIESKVRAWFNWANTQRPATDDYGEIT